MQFYLKGFDMFLCTEICVTSVYVYKVEYRIDYSTHDSYCKVGTTLQSLLV